MFFSPSVFQGEFGFIPDASARADKLALSDDCKCRKQGVGLGGLKSLFSAFSPASASLFGVEKGCTPLLSVRRRHTLYVAAYQDGKETKPRKPIHCMVSVVSPGCLLAEWLEGRNQHPTTQP